MSIEDLINDSNMLDLDSLPDVYTPKPVKRKVVRPVVEYDLEGEFIAAYNSIKEASNTTGVNEKTILNICAGRALHTRGLNDSIRIFLYRGDDIAKRLQQIKQQKDDWKLRHPHATKTVEICEYTLGGRFLFKYPTIKQAAKVNKVTTNLIHSCCKGAKPFIGKKIFMYPDDDIKQRVKNVKAELYRLSKKRPKYKPVDVYTLEGVFIKAFPSASATGRELNVHVSDITRCCNGTDGRGFNCFKSKGFIFLWVGDSISERLELIKQLKENKNE